MDIFILGVIHTAGLPFSPRPTSTIPDIELSIDFVRPCTDADRGATVVCVVDSSSCRLRRWSVDVTDTFSLLDGIVAATTTLVIIVCKRVLIARILRRNCSVASRRRSTSTYHCRHAVNDAAAVVKRVAAAGPDTTGWSSSTRHLK